ncbi:MAG: tetratricopeptide repeat protein, partial [Phycisphaerae bacterium]|nr:tetratricopeptide repeat protein [Phycisphaerae bacterium]NIP53293.1 tetratricopeptide repeat protein [Phycisphaerae bacterium]NIU09855.1 tetratricopeptide repeat protein [Phycisphaerae bacterium]NIU57511.1 tetratricopeptide repeat protein [Phycisphaerae bacterium]NIX01998.1 tetratricopeptide repeat protein [Phycisphaerae bacterium]
MRRARAIAYQAIHGPTRGDPAILQEAVEEYRLIVDKFPGEKDAVFKAQTEILGLYRRLGENEKALQLCKELAALPENQSGPRSVEVLSQLGFCYQALERWQDAEKVWLEAIQQNPDYDYGRIMIDVVYRKLDKPEKAEEQYLAIVHRAREEKRKSKAYCYIGRLWLDEGQYERAIPFYQKALDLDAQYNIRIHTLSGIGQCYEKLGMLKEAVEVNDKLAEFIGDKHPSWHSWRDGARAAAERLRQELEYDVNTIEGSERSQVDKKTINDIRTSDQNKAGKERMRQLREKQVVVRQVRDYEAARTVPQPIELWKAREYGCGGSPRTALKLRTDVKRRFPVLLAWPLIQDASKYVVQIQGLRGSRPARSFESKTNSLRLEKADLLPGRYQWSVSVYDRHGKHIGNIETIDPVEIFAIEDPQPVAANGKRVMIDLNHSAGHIRGWGCYNHAQYITKELLENVGFEVQVNERDLLTREKLKSVDLLICHYYWAGWPGFRPYLKSELSAVRQFVEKGGSLLVVGCDRKDGGGRMSEAGNQLVKEFGLMFELDKISEHNWAEVTPNQNVISFARPVNMQLPVGVVGENATTLLQFAGIPIVKAKQIGYGKVIVAGVGMSFLDCYLGDFEHRKSLHLIMFYDFIRYLTGINWKEHRRKKLVDTISLSADSKKGNVQVLFPKDSTILDINYVTAQPDDDSTVQDIEHLFILRECTYEVDTQDLLSGQTAEKSVLWAFYPS